MARLKDGQAAAASAAATAADSLSQKSIRSSSLPLYSMKCENVRNRLSRCQCYKRMCGVTYFFAGHSGQVELGVIVVMVKKCFGMTIASR